MYLQYAGTVQLTNVVVDHTTGTGVYEFGGNLTLTASTVQNSGGDGVAMVSNCCNWSSRILSIYTSTLQDNAGAGAHWQDQENWCAGAFTVQGTTITGNGRGIDATWSNNEGMTFVDNTITNNSGYGLDVDSPWQNRQQWVTVQGNTVTGNQGWGVYVGNWENNGQRRC